jgi:uncharacterized Zn-binding protein involved in type VI secretion
MGVIDSGSGERVGGDVYRSDDVATDGAPAIASGDTGTYPRPWLPGRCTFEDAR